MTKDDMIKGVERIIDERTHLRFTKENRYIIKSLLAKAIVNAIGVDKSHLIGYLNGNLCNKNGERTPKDEVDFFCDVLSQSPNILTIKEVKE